jgi:hypothetical protein
MLYFSFCGCSNLKVLIIRRDFLFFCPRLCCCGEKALARRAAGQVLAEIGRSYNVSHSTISRLG